MTLKCKHCGNEGTFYQKIQVYGSAVMYFDKERRYLMDGQNAGMYDHLNHKDGKYLYCNECDKRVGLLEPEGGA